MNKIKNAFVYARISGAHTQTELSIKEQIHQIRRYADSHGIHIEKEYTEVCSAFKTGGKKLLTARTIFFDMLNKINNSIDCILIFRYDRASRTGKEFNLLEEKCLKHGVEIVSITESFGQEQGPISNFLVRNSMNLSQLYSEELSFKCKLGMRRAMKEGKLPGSVLPIGYVRIKKNTAIIDEEKAKFIKEAFELYATGNHTFLSIAEILGKKGFTNKEGKIITNKNIESILGHEIYTGFKTMHWGLKKYELQYYEGSKNIGTFAEKYKLNLEPIISEELYSAVINIRKTRSNYGIKEKQNKNDRKGKQKIGEYIFSQLVKCHCGRHFVGQYNKQKKIMYYGCSRSITNNFSEKCHEPYVQEKELFIEIKDILNKLYIKPASLDKFKLALDKVFSTDGKERDKTIISNIDKIKEIKDKQTNLTEKFMEGKIQQENYDLLNQKYIDEKIILEIENDRCINFEGSNEAKNKIFTYFLWTNWLIEQTYEHFKVSVTQVWRTKLKWTGANLIFESKKPLTYAVNGPLDFYQNVSNLKWLRRYELNVRPQGYEPCELPLLYSAINVVWADYRTKML